MKKNANRSVDETQLLWLRHFSAGVCAGGASRTCTAPIDRLRTFFQGKHRQMDSLHSFSFSVFSLWIGFQCPNDHSNDFIVDDQRRRRSLALARQSNECDQSLPGNRPAIDVLRSLQTPIGTDSDARGQHLREVSLWVRGGCHSQCFGLSNEDDQGKSRGTATTRRTWRRAGRPSRLV